ncbi:hypothetical protein FHR92_004353 [Fontibacillus solani]|uniref:Uncharacterized protein n=1 Tax=Fontibacillus solani TaxID=1572857 RepID=A0A7W3XTQ5_9BACL|nr:hypothetical protein [Fontibacillus solani]MBA9087860.1 hypothetical protein [Fontibacillus solani]
MNHIIRINVVSVLYALFIFIPIELMLNVYRISRVTGWEIKTVNNLNVIVIMVDIILGTAIFYLLTAKWLGRSKLNYINIILWIPFFILFVYIFALLFPITNGGDDPNPVTGLIVIGALFLYPIYILFINLISMSIDNN